MVAKKTADIAKEMFRRFANKSVGFCFLDTELRYIEINDHLAAINGIPAAEHIGKTISDVLPQIAAAGAENELRSVLKTGEPIIKSTVTAATPGSQDESRTFLHDYSAIYSDNRELVGVSCCVMDISDYQSLLAGGIPADLTGLKSELTDRQREILFLIVQGLSAKQIAFRLGLSTKTIEYHKYNTMAKLKISTTADLIRYAIKHKISQS